MSHDDRFSLASLIVTLVIGFVIGLIITVLAMVVSPWLRSDWYWMGPAIIGACMFIVLCIRYGSGADSITPWW